MVPSNDLFTDYIRSAFVAQTIMSGQVPAVTGSANTFGTDGTQCSTSNARVYGADTGRGIPYSVIEQIAYFHPAATGTYTFSFPTRMDDGVLLWFGDSVRAGWTSANADFGINGGAKTTQNEATTFSYSATAGEYVPFRLLFVDAQQCGFFDMEARDPSGNLIVSATTASTDGQFVWGCSSDVDAPAFGF